MKTLVRYGFILGLICLLAGGMLSVVNFITLPRIIAQAKEQERKTLLAVLPGSASFEPIKLGDEILYYRAYDKDGKLIGTAFKAEKRGYSSTVQTMVGMLPDEKISVVKILEQNETPGLGNRITELSFTSQFDNKDASELSQVQAITGATISSKAVMEAVKAKVEEIKILLKNEK